jgi:hypothetical protein
VIYVEDDFMGVSDIVIIERLVENHILNWVIGFFFFFKKKITYFEININLIEVKRKDLGNHSFRRIPYGKKEIKQSN